MPSPDSNHSAKPNSHGIELEINPEWEVHPAQLAECRTKEPNLLLLDVRRPDEFAKAQIPGATFIPMNEIEARLESELAAQKSRAIIVFCHHGARSLRVTAFLRHHGFTNVLSLAGGIDAYSLIIDPSVPRYR
ncbi:MAG TPA: rhodanese-like domain-containing protein [Phycisphaerae bacterium]|nr:rhodanese-like domain-containing protein [Phycisphaerae bacterium]